ncbi:MAG: ATP-binding protein [Clostridiales Family XIII bacterium]|jgi:serine/threonine-protein kinase RsbW|nr:ATP-binding protein [Clostridiales Family XIII bacterium]
MSETLKLSVPCDARYVSTVRLAVSSVASLAGFDIEAIEDIKIAVSEACTNIILHGGLGESAYNVICALEDGGLELVVEDDGVGFAYEEYEKPNLEEPSEGGLGLYIILALMDDVKVSSQAGAGTSIRMKKFRPAG